jgi:hypothetical protein
MHHWQHSDATIASLQCNNRSTPMQQQQHSNSTISVLHHCLRCGAMRHAALQRFNCCIETRHHAPRSTAALQLLHCSTATRHNAPRSTATRRNAWHGSTTIEVLQCIIGNARHGSTPLLSYALCSGLEGTSSNDLQKNRNMLSLPQNPPPLTLSLKPPLLTP